MIEDPRIYTESSREKSAIDRYGKRGRDEKRWTSGFVLEPMEEEEGMARAYLLVILESCADES